MSGSVNLFEFPSTGRLNYCSSLLPVRRAEKPNEDFRMKEKRKAPTGDIGDASGLFQESDNETLTTLALVVPRDRATRSGATTGIHRVHRYAITRDFRQFKAALRLCLGAAELPRSLASRRSVWGLPEAC